MGSFVYTQLPIQLDATCNGYQHLAMLSRDNDLGKNLNLMSAKKDNVPNDFYSLLLNRVTQNLLELSKLEDNGGIKEDGKINAYKRIITFKPGRGFIKKSVMVEAYNAGTITLADNLREACYCINEPDLEWFCLILGKEKR